MCEFCSNFKNKERKFRLFEVNPIPFLLRIDQEEWFILQLNQINLLTFY
ncbi:hypothetical protein bcgnr5376_48430 [Bacillus cereus]